MTSRHNCTGTLEGTLEGKDSLSRLFQVFIQLLNLTQMIQAYISLLVLLELLLYLHQNFFLPCLGNFPHSNHNGRDNYISNDCKHAEDGES